MVHVWHVVFVTTISSNWLHLFAKTGKHEFRKESLYTKLLNQITFQWSIQTIILSQSFYFCSADCHWSIFFRYFFRCFTCICPTPIPLASSPPFSVTRLLEGHSWHHLWQSLVSMDWSCWSSITPYHFLHGSHTLLGSSAVTFKAPLQY